MSELRDYHDEPRPYGGQSKPTTIIVRVEADGWKGAFVLPETCFEELTSYLTKQLASKEGK